MNGFDGVMYCVTVIPKIGLDATGKWSPETKREWGRLIRMDDEIVRIVSEKWPRLGLPGDGKPVWK